ncbi:MAG: TetR/AcrR family transcriptional regulator [Nitriliruptoraceae bacterium]
MDAVASRAGVSKATIYRRWTSKQDVVIAAAESLAQSVPAPDTGTVRQDLAMIAGGLVAVFAADTSSRLVGALLAEATRSTPSSRRQSSMLCYQYTAIDRMPIGLTLKG